MKRVLVVDDERPVVEAIELMIRRDLSQEFSVVGDASSGRDAIEQAVALAPDIVLMDIWMPGISGLDAVREIRARGMPCVFILVTAYERFDIAREAMVLGVLDYLLKPVARDKLAFALRSAADFADRRFEIERREMEHREREERLRSFVEEAFLRAIIMDEGLGFDFKRYGFALGLSRGRAIVAAASFLPSPGSPDPDGEVRSLYEEFRATVRYKTKALAGPFLAGFSIALLSLSAGDSEAEEMEAFRSALEQNHGSQLSAGALRLGYSPPSPLSEANQAWAKALEEVLRPEAEPGEETYAPGASPEDSFRGFEDERAFVVSLVNGEAGRARISLERLVRSVPGSPGIATWYRYRMAGLFLDAYREFEARGFLSPEETRALMDIGDFSKAENAASLVLIAKSRFKVLSEASGRAPRWSPPIARTVAYVKENFGNPISLESASAEVSLSPNRLSRLFSEETGRGFSDFLIEVRIERAKKMLSESGVSIKQVSAACGYSDPNYFSRLFKKVTGITPTAFSSGPWEAQDAES